MGRRVLYVLAAVWAVALAASLARRAAAPRPPAAADRAAAESGDPAYHAFLLGVRAEATATGYSPAGVRESRAPAVLLFVDDPAREDEFLSYRAAFELWPSAVHLAFRPLPRPGAPISLAADDEVWAAKHRPGVLGLYPRKKPAAARLRRITEDHRGRLETAPARHADGLPDAGKAGAPAGSAPRARPAVWAGGVAFLLALGLWIAFRSGLIGGLRGVPTALALGWVAGAGLFGWVAVMMSLGGVPWITVWVPLVSVALAGALGRLSIRKAAGPAPVSGLDLVGMVLVAAGCAIAVAQALAPQSAWSNWDAWAIWDFKVKAALDSSGVPVAFLTNPDYGFTHPEYPFGWPAIQSFLASCSGGFSVGPTGSPDTRLLRLASPLWAACVPVLLAVLLAEVGIHRGRWLIAGAVALLPAALTQSSNGYVDWPVAATTTAALVFLLRAGRGAGPAWPAVLFAGLAANLKNEAVVFGLGVLLALLVAAFTRKVRWGGFGAAVVLWLVLVVPWRVFAIAHSLPPRDFSFDPSTILDAAPGRIGLFVQAVALECFGPGLGGGAFASGAPVPWHEWLAHLLNSWLVLWFAVAAALVFGWRRLWRPGARELLLVVGVQVLAAVAAYVLTIRDPRWLLASSLDRLLLQWVPAVVALCASLVVRSPQVD